MFASGIPAKCIRINLFLLCKKTFPFLFSFISLVSAAQEGFQLAPPQTASASVFFQLSTCVSFDFRQPGAVIRYALNGDEPDENSAVYQQPICVSASAIIKAKSFAGGFIPSETVTVRCIKVTNAIKSINGSVPANPYNKGGLAALIDRQSGGKTFRERWLGFRGDTVFWKLKFTRKQKISKLHISLMQAQGAWIFYPVKMELVSPKGKMLGLGFFNSNTGPSGDETRIFSFPLGRKLKGVIIRIQNYSSIPEWHAAKGNKPWLFADEIAVE